MIFKSDPPTIHILTVNYLSPVPRRSWPQSGGPPVLHSLSGVSKIRGLSLLAGIVRWRVIVGASLLNMKRPRTVVCTSWSDQGWGSGRTVLLSVNEQEAVCVYACVLFTLYCSWRGRR